MLPRTSKSFAITFVSLAVSLGLSGCDDTSSSKIGIGTSASQGAAVAGRLVSDITSSALSTSATCTSPTASLYSYDSTGVRSGSPVASVALKSDYSYSFDVAKYAIKLGNTTTPTAYVVSITGCGTQLYMRPVTGLKNQDVTMASTVLAYTLDTSHSASVVTTLNSSATSVDAVLASMSGTTFADAYASINSTTFSSTFGFPSTDLTTASPQVIVVTVPSTGSEHVTINATASVQHWSSTYAAAYEWKLDGTTVATGANFTFTPNSNQQGTHTLVVSIGANDGTSHVDSSKPFNTVSNSIVIANNNLPVSPTFTVTSPVVSGTTPINSRALTLSINTGALLANCESISSFLISESATAPSAADTFPQTCTTAGSQTLSYTLLSPGDGPKMLYLWSIDASGTVSAAASTVSFFLDTAPPTISITTSPLALSNHTVESIPFVAVDNGGTIDHYECKLDSNSFAACTSPNSLTALAQGAHTFSVKAIDTAGNVSNIATASWTSDQTAPAVTITGNPASPTNAVAATFSFTSADTGGAAVAQVYCSIDGGAAVACATPYVTTLVQGVHTFRAYATDTAGNIGAAATSTWTIDTTAPTTSITSKPVSLTNSQTGTFVFNGTDTGGATVSQFDCQIDGGSWATCTSPKSYTSLAAGSHTFGVRARDTAGNVGTGTTYTWTIDLTTPMASITAQPASITNAVTASFSFTATAPPDGSITGYVCSLDGAAYAACTSPKAYAGLVQGAHTFGVKSVDNNSNQSSASTYAWTIDTTNPVATISVSPSNPSSNATPSITFSATDTGGGSVASFQCKVDSASYAACTSPKLLTTLADGSHTFYVQALDTAGNTSAAATATWTVDTTLPVASFSATPAAVTNATTAHFVFAATDSSAISGYQCAVDGGSYAACTSPQDLTALTQTTHSFAIKATDAAGNVSAVTTYSWIVDLTNPTVTISAQPNANTNSQTASFTFAGADTGGGTVASYSCQLDSAGYSACTSVKTYTGVAAGAHTFYVKATDTAGNVSSVTSFAWTVDLTAPVLTVSTPATDATVPLSSALSSVTFSGTCTENGINVVISGALTGTASCASGAWSTSLNLSALTDGTASFTFTQTDLATNVGSATRTINVDKTNPSVTLTSFNSGGAVSGGSSQNITWTVTDANLGTTPITLFYSTDSGSTYTSLGSAVANSGTFAWTVPSALNNTTVKVKVTALDKAGNTASASSATVFTIDGTVPVMSTFTVNGGTSTTTTNNIPVSLSATDNYKITQFCLKYNTSTAPLLTDSCWTNVATAGGTAGTSVSFSNFYFRIGFISGAYTVNAWIRDEAGNISVLSNTSGVDTGAVTYSPGAPPTMSSVIAVSNTSPATPPAASDLTSPSASDVYIFWKAAGSSLPANAISLTYTTDDSTYSTVPGASGLPNSQGAGCTLFGSYTGCFKWSSGSPTTNFYRVQAKVTDSASYSALASSPAVNANVVKFLAGNTDVGTNASATTGIFIAPAQYVNNSANGSMLVHPDGTIFYADASRGLLKIDPTTGITSVLLKQTGATSGNNVAVSSATVAAISKIAFDANSNILVRDYNSIRRIDLSTSIISTVIGGGASLADGVAATSFNVYNIGVTGRGWNTLEALKNGDILFKNESGPYIHWYKSATQTVSLITASGTGLFPGAGGSLSVATCANSIFNWTTLIDVSGTLTGFLISEMSAPDGTGACSYTGSGYGVAEGIFDTTGAIVSSNGLRTNTPAYVIGRDGKLYEHARGNPIYSYNQTTKAWTALTASGLANCAEGATFSSCPDNYDDFFVDKGGHYYLSDNGMIRTVTDAGAILTLAGQSYNYGDGQDPLIARFGYLRNFNYWTASGVDKLITLDVQAHQLREFPLTSSSTVTSIAGNGSTGQPSTSSLANAQPIFDKGYTYESGFGVDGNGNVFMSSGVNLLAKLDRTSGKWTTISGTTTLYTAAAEGVASNTVSFNGVQNGLIQVMGSANGKVILNPSTIVSTQNSYPAIKFIDMAGLTYSSLTWNTSTNVSQYFFSASGTALTNVAVPMVDYANSAIAFDSTNNLWFMTSANDNNVYKLTPGGNLVSYFANGTQINAMGYRRVDATTENFFTCNATGTIRKTTLVSGAVTSATNLQWPIPSIACTYGSILYNSVRGSIMFVYKQNGLYGVAEYLNP